EAVDDVQTLVLTSANSSKFKTIDNILFNIEETLKSSKGFKGFEGDSNSFGSGKRIIIDLYEYNEAGEEAKRGKKMVQVIIEPYVM
ncbi:hypothetical protein Tco_0219235, partial [Tanacetum coccineum]